MPLEALRFALRQIRPNTRPFPKAIEQVDIETVASAVTSVTC